MDESLYDVLHVAPSADAEDIKSAYRRLAKECHPDLNPNDPRAEARFKELSAAFHILGDPERRARYDDGEIDDEGVERPSDTFYRFHADGPDGRRYAASPDPFADFLQDGLMGDGMLGARNALRGADIRHEITIGFIDAALGTKRTVILADGRNLDLAIPAGIEDGQTMRVKGKGALAAGPGVPGDALIRVCVERHPIFTRQGPSVHLDLPLTLAEAILGTELRVPTIHGPVTARVPAGVNGGTVMRIRGKGIQAPGDQAAGDQFVTIRIVLPETKDFELEAFMRDWQRRNADNPRRHWEGLT
ncbi:MAG: DnaJ C-terminal domain-containing protein [Alphaproteobacteria bacterium]